MHRVIRSSLPGQYPYVPLQIWTTPDHPPGADSAQVIVEWHSGQWGHPSSYAVLGGDLTDGPARLDFPEGGAVFRKTRYGRDSERLGLPTEYRDAVLGALPPGVRITVAAHHEEGSSQVAFAIAARLLGEFLTGAIPASDADVLELEASTRDIYRR
jgi:hypothetical protein